MDDIKEIVTNLQVSPDDLKHHLTTIGNGIPELKTWFERNEKWIKQNYDDGCYHDLNSFGYGNPEQQLDKIKKSLTELRTIISQHAPLQNKPFPNLDLLLSNFETRITNLITLPCDGDQPVSPPQRPNRLQ